uniref:Uncharacterized protein n=1 Tax=Meloidogyne javanica TaxID=6303 RepID=A0A915MMT3_MELJA
MRKKSQVEAKDNLAFLAEYYSKTFIKDSENKIEIDYKLFYEKSILILDSKIEEISRQIKSKAAPSKKANTKSSGKKKPKGGAGSTSQTAEATSELDEHFEKYKKLRDKIRKGIENLEKAPGTESTPESTTSSESKIVVLDNEEDNLAFAFLHINEVKKLLFKEDQPFKKSDSNVFAKEFYKLNDQNLINVKARMRRFLGNENIILSEINPIKVVDIEAGLRLSKLFEIGLKDIGLKDKIEKDDDIKSEVSTTNVEESGTSEEKQEKKGSKKKKNKQEKNQEKTCLSEFFKEKLDVLSERQASLEEQRKEFIRFLGLRYCDEVAKSIKQKPGGMINTNKYSDQITESLKVELTRDLLKIYNNDEKFKEEYLSLEIKGAKWRIIKFLQIEGNIEEIFEKPKKHMDAYNLLKNEEEKMTQDVPRLEGPSSLEKTESERGADSKSDVDPEDLKKTSDGKKRLRHLQGSKTSRSIDSDSTPPNSPSSIYELKFNVTDEKMSKYIENFEKFFHSEIELEKHAQLVDANGVFWYFEMGIQNMLWVSIKLTYDRI